MIKHSPHFFMEVLLRKLHSTADKFASLNQEGTVILFTTRDQPKLKQTISLAEGKRIFEDLYGSIEQRWEVSAEFAAKQQLIKRKQTARANRSGASRKPYNNELVTHKGAA